MLRASARQTQEGIRLRLVLLGLPGAGKGTQAALLAGVAGVPHVATGSIFRQAVADGTPLGLQVQAVMERGGLVPDTLTIAIVRDRLAREDCRGGFVLDGFPRTLAQGESLDASLAAMGQELTRAVHLDIAEERAIARLAGRRTCTHCGATYHIEADPPAPGGRCRRCGNIVIQRADDAEDAQRRRIEAYRRDTEPLLAYYDRQGKLVRVFADRPMTEVADDLARLARPGTGGDVAG